MFPILNSPFFFSQSFRLSLFPLLEWQMEKDTERQTSLVFRHKHLQSQSWARRKLGCMNSVWTSMWVAGMLAPEPLQPASQDLYLQETVGSWTKTQNLHYNMDYGYPKWNFNTAPNAFLRVALSLKYEGWTSQKWYLPGKQSQYFLSTFSYLTFGV